MNSSAIIVIIIFLPFESNLLVNLGLSLDGSKQGRKNGQDHSEFETIIVIISRRFLIGDLPNYQH